jgi:hypothetical protein
MSTGKKRQDKSHSFVVHVVSLVAAAVLMAASLAEGWGAGITAAGVLAALSGAAALRAKRSLLAPPGLRQALELSTESKEKREVEKASASVGGWVLIVSGATVAAVALFGSC